MIAHLALTLAAGFAQQTAKADSTAYAEYVVWPKGLPPAGASPKVKFATHSWSLAHREKSGDVESHGSRGIVMIVQSGEATLVVGNDVVDAKETAPGEIRGTSIRNGISRKVMAGDVINNMPAGLPHQFLLEPGEQITYIDVVVPATPATPAKQ